MKNKVRILILEDTQKKREEILEIFKKDCCLIDSVDNINSCLEYLSSTFYDLVILDMKIPRRQGEDAIDYGGEEVLNDLYSNNSYKMPGRIIALTRYEDLKEKLQQNYAEISVIRYCNPPENSDCLKRENS
ncbi:response regulator [Sphingobacterium sp. 1.A.4]|uniref:response regulator n=1 Tax=Sphingobacterium sp. 1.A.4 TaxID=2044603 RepID=UPI000C0BFD74|nr:response regulator [Sphingobacterium sp. 1.A.4]